MNRSLSRCLVVALCTTAFAASPAQAQALSNGDFSAGLSGWQLLGDASVQPAATTGSQLWLTTASALSEDDFPLPAGALNRSGTGAAEVGVPGGVESFTGLTLGALDPDPAGGLAAYEGSAARQTFSAAAGDTLSFRWNFGTSDTFADYAFVVVDGQLTQLGGSVDATLPGSFGNLLQTGDRLFSLSLASAGSHTVSFGVVDVGDFSVTSTLAIAGVQISPVPESDALVLLLAGLGVVGAAGRRRSRT